MQPLVGAVFTCGTACAADLAVLHDAKLIEHAANDGDSFLVEVNGKQLRVRLYFVDCMETQPGNEDDERRIEQQRMHFGLSDVRAVVHYGQVARAYVQDVLSRPFSIYTNYTSTPGRSSRGRIYGFIKTHDGEYLSEKLVRAGLARILGVTRENPDGRPSEVTLRHLHVLRKDAIARSAGAWKEGAPRLYDLNCASKDTLRSIPGIGRKTAEKIIAARPYRTKGELLRVHGIGPVKFEKIAPYVTVHPSTIDQC